MAFATTKHLKLRAYRESDKDIFLALINDQRTTRTSNPGFAVPKGEKTWKEMEEKSLSTALIVVFVEVKREYASLRKWDEWEVRKADTEKTQEDWDRELFAGYSSVHLKHPKVRDGRFGIVIAPPWWGNGFATEVTEWVVQHCFEQLNLHRLSLGYLANNAAAKRVYEKCGFVHEGVTRQAWWLDGGWVDQGDMGILEDEYSARKKQLTNEH
ncbi:acyl-CoA N-acyltransferase [Calocera cornea HHB12733]|uniref:Acyl-CoA N-acyltransferase n=1 Tax=Calocera cornea HHB12733 TaxID=1353952 RepID=A0A165D419_9BASI|nr:acyl-CoA N-acyltransferase [Calocera cornea HHB12733]